MIEPLHIAIAAEGHIAALLQPADSDFSIAILHDLDTDVDSVSALMGAVGLRDLRLIGLDLPGHGLSSGNGLPPDALAPLVEASRQLLERGWGPFLPVGFGRSADLAMQLCARVPSVGLAVVSPVSGHLLREPAWPRIPLLSFVAAKDAESASEWQRFRTHAVMSWMSVSLPGTHSELMRPSGGVARLLASHLGGFARDVAATRAPADRPDRNGVDRQTTFLQHPRG